MKYENQALAVNIVAQGVEKTANLPQEERLEHLQQVYKFAKKHVRKNWYLLNWINSMAPVYGVNESLSGK